MIGEIIISVLLLLILTAMCLFWPRRVTPQAGQTAVQLFEERLQLLALARDSGELAEQDFDNAAAELKSQFLHKPQPQAVTGRLNWRLPVSLLAATLLIVVAIYAINGHYRQLAEWQYARQNLQSFGERALLGQGEPLSEQQIELFALALRTKLAREGDDAVAWMLLGRIRMSQGAMQEAVAAFERALSMTPNRTPLLLSYSQALIVLGDENSLATAAHAVARVLTAEPDNSDALSLMALIAYERGDFAEATTAWQLLLKQLPAEDLRYAAVQQRLQQLGADIAASGRQIKVSLTVSPALRQAHPDATLFLFARAVDGAALPLAVQRVALPQGQVELLLTEQMAMQSGWSLANAEQVQVVARMSLAGTVVQRAGDVQVESEILQFNQPVLSVSLQLEP
ncbi:MAG: c-type cytochrome biogenesis protein CcmI [Gammaproteobacteria bacterium]|nr:c-type cytochrome biogenesis protein CcmI [Gammaproteobacteria bacterium]MBU1553203.1 c-type cytochrome biogenesis protein CcmI [Gammaproteobacteria bacterium]MBU2069630.1 c-type cytochrome biogenesis protein CcmI [Gammaproteobacteria bacterium]MBU2184495.1 c-type cytochrome biogenesis protein CcmI [Gammaproteobacteria bacterium]MBU2205177.1 c-type cytochrome biogenesis protein CcmI [Gammaproteobacteria bacterium]